MACAAWRARLYYKNADEEVSEPEINNPHAKTQERKKHVRPPFLQIIVFGDCPAFCIAESMRFALVVQGFTQMVLSAAKPFPVAPCVMFSLAICWLLVIHCYTSFSSENLEIIQLFVVTCDACFG